MKRFIKSLFVIIILGSIGVFAYRLYPGFVKASPIPNIPTITPIISIYKVLNPPKVVPTEEPTAAAMRLIPVPEYIPTLVYIKDLVTSDTPATLELINDWSTVITLDFEGMIVTINPGSTEKVQFPPGSYKYTARASDCGSPSTSTIELEANQTYQIRFFCSSSGVYSEQPTGNEGFFVVTNRTDMILTLTVDDRTYEIPIGTIEIMLPPGTYTVTVTASGAFPYSSQETIYPGGRTSVVYSFR